MKKTLFFIMAVALCTSLMAQSFYKPITVIPQSVPFTEAAQIGGASTHDTDATVPTTRPSLMLSEPGYALDLIGQTHYSLPTNTYARNTITFRQDSPHAVAAWTTANRQNASRGTGINYYDMTNESWRPMPPANARIESVRTGWGTPGFTSKGEIVVAHNANSDSTGGLVISTRDNWGQGDWNQYVLQCTPYTMSTDWEGLKTYNATGLLWPTMVTNGNTVHVVAVTEQAPSDGRPPDGCDEYVHGYPVNGKTYPTVPLYYRSSDGGKTWDIKEYHFGNDGMTDYELRYVSGDNYVMAVRGEHIVFLYSAYYVIHYMESRDNGVTWTKKEVYDAGHFAEEEVSDLPARLVPKTCAIFIDENHKVHVVFGTQVCVKRGAGCSWNYWPTAPTGMVYWNDSKDPIHWTDVAGKETEEGLFMYESEWYNYPGYIDLPTVLGFDRFYRWLSGPEYSTEQFRDCGYIVFPRVVARDGRVFISYQSPLDWPLSIGPNEYHRGIFMTVSEDDGETWEIQKNTSWLSYHPELFQANWDDFEEPEYDPVNDAWYWDPNSIVVSTRTENAYPTMSTNIKDSRVLLQWFHQEAPFMDLSNLFTFDPILIYTFNQGLWMFPEYNNIQEIWQGEWNKVTENQQPTINAKIYPNPATDGMVNVKVDANAPYTLTVTNIMGQVVYNAQDVTTINISNFTPGIYIVNIKTDKATTSQKLIVK